ncbi:mcfN [Symbiodinium microadriaticum]|nr:mcfN [Symbiodinium microadriaticum]
MAHPSLKRADEFLEVFNRKFDKKYSSIESFNAARKPYWQMILTGMERAEACKSCPFVRAIVAMEVAVRAGHAGMLPPKASAKMFSGIESKLQIPIETSKDGVDLQDEKIPAILGMAIRGLPSRNEIPAPVLARLLYGAEGLAVCDHITGWVKEGKELAYWEHDFKHLANLLLDHLEVDQQSRAAFDGKVARKIEGAKARRLEGLQRSMQDGSLQEMLQQAMRPKIQEYQGGPWRPMTDEELEEEQQFLRGFSPDFLSSWHHLFAGFPPLLLRQVFFGMAKFLVFDTVAAMVYRQLPWMANRKGTSSMVSMFSGAVAGIISTFVSQPADAILTCMSATPQLGIAGAASALWRDGQFGAFYAGFSTRAAWAAAIIGGQFLLYDVAKRIFRVTHGDLSQTADALSLALRNDQVFQPSQPGLAGGPRPRTVSATSRRFVHGRLRPPVLVGRSWLRRIRCRFLSERP